MSFDLRVIQGDLALSPTRDLAKVENSEKLTQDVLKIISTPIGGNPFFPFYGCPLTRSLVGTAYESKFIASMATDQLQTSLEILQSIQKEQLKTNQLVTAQEQIAAIQDVLVDRNINDPRFFRIEITVLSKAFKRIETQLDISL